MSVAPPKRPAKIKAGPRCTLHHGDDHHARVSIPYGHGAKMKAEVKRVTGRDALQFNREFAGRWSLHHYYIPELVRSGILHTSQEFSLKVVRQIEKAWEGKSPNDAHLYGDFEGMDLDNFDADKVPLAHPLYPFQKEGVTALVQALREGGCLLGDEMGLGKTIQSMATALAHGERIVVICPANLVFNWCGEVFNHAPAWKVHVHRMRAGTRALQGVFGEKHRNFTDVPEQASMIISSYEASRSFCVNTPDGEQTADRRLDVHPHFQEIFKDRILIIDEAHYAKNLGAHRTQATLAVSRAVKDTIAMTGTPILNRPGELWSILTAIGRQHEIACDWFEYEQRFIKNAEWIELNRRLTSSKWFVRRLKADVLKDLPAKRRGELLVQMPTDLDRQYRAARQGLSRKGLKMANALAILTELQTIANEAKVAPLCEYLVDRYDQGLPTAVSSTRSVPLRMLYEQLTKAGVKAALVYGETSTTERTRLVEAFQRGDLDVFLTTVSEGLTLTRADTMVLLDVPWNPGNVSQREDRIHRIGQEAERVQVYRCIAASIDRHKVDIVCGKQAMIGVTIDGGRNMTAMETDLQSKVIERLMAENEGEE